MAGYLDQYGAGEERRNQIIFRSLMTLLVIAVVGSLSWFLLLNHHQEHVADTFIDAVKRGDLPGAYRIWGCTDAKPCPGYEYSKFVRDFGPGPNGPDLNLLALTDSEECNNAAMLTLRVNSNRTDFLWIEKGDDKMGFAPFEICPAQIPYAIMAHRTLGKLRKLFLK